MTVNRTMREAGEACPQQRRGAHLDEGDTFTAMYTGPHPEQYRASLAGPFEDGL